MSPLPIDHVLPQLCEALRARQGAVLQAPPGAGKTTRVPLALLDQPWLAGQRILMLEPRRLAARTVATYMAELLHEPVGATVGYRMRMDSRCGPKTRIEVVTEGVLTRMLQRDAALEGVGLVIFDEFHERSLQADLGLALCLDAQHGLRDDLRLLVMSATLEAAPVAQLLGGAPLITSEGRSYPVEVRYLGRPADGQVTQSAASAVRRALREDSGSLLVFLPGVGEIRRTLALLQQSAVDSNVHLAPLYGDLSYEQQEQAIRPAAPGTRKVVLATSIAETSLTIEGIRVVIDSGLMRVPRFEPRSGLTRLATVPVTQSSAEQRRGRAGRLETGVCYRLWSEADQPRLLAQGQPEILEADLAPLALELALWGVRDCMQLRWLDPPQPAALTQARELLHRLGALDADGGITAHGRQLAALGAHPRLAHMMLAGRALGLGATACDLAALLGERDVLRSREGGRAADAHLRLVALHAPHPAPDVDRGACQRVRKAAHQWQRQLGIDPGTTDPDAAGVLLALAYPDRIAQRRAGEAARYRLANGRGAMLRESDALSSAEFLAVADLDGAEREARIFLAAPLTLTQINEQFADQIREATFVTWDEQSGAVLARRQRRLGELVLGDAPLAHPDPERVCAALLAGLRRHGLEVLPWEHETHELRARILFLRRTVGEQWPDVSDEALLAGLEHWLAPFVTGLSRLNHLARVDLRNALLSLLDWPQRQALDELAPTHVAVPSGSRIRIDYSGSTPHLAVRLQEVFGLRETPRLAGGRVPLTIQLLSPARRPVQITQDLASFWANTYHEVKKDLKGRYPKHYWPDDPLQAEAIRGVRPR